MNTQNFNDNIDIEIEDIFNRKNQIENVYSMIRNDDNGFVATIDSQFGMGKTTFLKMLKRHIDSQYDNKIISIYYDAWENDFFINPFLSLLSCFDQELKEFNNATFPDFISTLGDITSNTVSFLTAGIINPSEQYNKMKSTPIREMISEYEDTKKIRKDIYNLFMNLTKNNDENYKVVFFIDELDRCKPTFALDLLETIKLFFNLPNYYFIIAVHKNQIASTIKLKYGSEIDSTGYLRRFIDFDIILNPISIEKYVNLHSKEYLEKHSDFQELFDMLIILAENSNLSLRDLDKIFLLLRLILPEDWLTNRVKFRQHQDNADVCFELHLLALLLVLKVNNAELYKKFINKTLSQEEINFISEFIKSEKLFHESIELKLQNNFHGQLSFKYLFHQAFRNFYEPYKLDKIDNSKPLYSFKGHTVSIRVLVREKNLNLDVISKIQISDFIK